MHKQNSRRRRGQVGALFAFGFLALAGWGVYVWLFAGLPSPDELYNRAAAPSSKIYDRRGQLLYEVIDPHLGKHSPLALDEIPLTLQNATVATEDAHFYTHPGIDIRGILRAVWIELHGGESGGSTITQQVARNLLLSPDERAQRTMTRKLREWILAWRLSRAYSKQDILALYLNENYYGNMAYGVEAAAHAYLGKEVGELDLAECALLAGLPQAPSLYNPLIDLAAAKRRQRIVLDLMVKQGYISPQTADLAASEPLKFVATPFPIRAPHFVTFVWSMLESELGADTLARGGLEVYTTLDVDLQERGAKIIRRQLRALQDRRGPDRNVNNAALLAVDPQTGEILAMIGSADYFDADIGGAVNVCLSLRQPGSAIKPITYASAFDPTWAQREQANTRWGALPFTPATMLVDVRTSFVTREGIGYVPLNYDRRWHGPVLLREALGASYNLPAVQVLDAIGLEAMRSLSRRMGISTFDRSVERFGLALTLGGGEVRMLELASVYGVFATGGKLIPPVSVYKVVDAHGETIWMAQRQTPRQVLDARVAYLITDILADEWARLPSFGEESALYIGRPAAAKTGTTTDWRDNWTIGYTPDLLTAVWVGNADNTPMYHVSGITGAGPIWHDFMIWALQNRPAQTFARPEGLVRVEVCSLSGRLPNQYCPHRRQELFIDGTQPTSECDMHRLVRIDAATGLQATEATPPERVRQRIYAVYPPEAQAWAMAHGVPQPPPRPGRDDEPAQPEPGHEPAALIEIVSPFQMDRYRITAELPPEDQRIMVEARQSAGGDLVHVTLFVDEQAIAAFAQPPYRAWWTLQLGEHQIYAVGETPEGESVRSEAITLIVVQ